MMLLIVMSGCGLWLQAATLDSLRIIDEVTVQSQIRYHETIAPQTLRGEALARVNAHTVADALRYMSGVQMKDYGGIGGLKTVNLRSMGSQHVGIYYDGVELSNAQNGVIDLGQLSLDNVEEVSLYQGQRSAILQTASDFANAGSIYIRTKRGEAVRNQAKIHTGSFGLLRMSGLMGWKLYDRLCLNANVETMAGNGRYSFRYRRRNYDGSIAYDTTATRQNGDVQALRGELNLQGKLQDGFWEAKAYTYHSNRGIPGAIVNNVWRRGERQSDDNTWLQGQWQRDIGTRYTLRAMAKYAYYRTHYLNRDTTQLMVDNTFRQQEAYASLTQVLELAQWWSLSLSYDARWNRLDADVARFAEPIRWTHNVAVATAMDLHRLQLQGSLVYVGVQDRLHAAQYSNTQAASAQHSCWAPALFTSYRISPLWQLTGFVKRSYRMPTFNDLYYTDMGNALLQPEKVWQMDIGTRLSSRSPCQGEGQLHTGIHWAVEAHLYHNVVDDKIVAYPKGQQFRWTMLNLGKVHIDGIDLNAEAEWRYANALRMAIRAQYTYQRARDVTNRNDSYYGHQIPYTPWHSGSTTFTLDWHEWNLAYNWVYTGERYCQQENIAYNRLQPWYTSDAHLAWRHHFGKTLGKVTLEVNNLLDQQYDVIINYPMPGRNYLLTVQWEF